MDILDVLIDFEKNKYIPRIFIHNSYIILEIPSLITMYQINNNHLKYFFNIRFTVMTV